MEDYLVIHKGEELRRVALNRILYVIADGNCSKFYLSHDEFFTMPMLFREVASLMAEQFGSNVKTFARVGRNLIINLSYLYYINPTTEVLVLLDGNMEKFELHASRASLKTLMDLVEDRTMLFV